MKNLLTLGYIVFFTLLLFSFLIFLLFSLPDNDCLIAEGKTLVVSKDGNGNHTTIQAAIENATDGDIIRVYEGIYYEQVTVDKQLELQGNGSHETTIDGGNVSDTVLISADGVVFQDFTVTNCKEYHGGVRISADRVSIFRTHCIDNNGIGITSAGYDGIHLEGNNCSGNSMGISLTADNVLILNNTCSNNPGTGSQGIYFRGSNVTISGNFINDNYYGIRVMVSNNITISQNEIQDNYYAMYAYNSVDVNVTAITCIDNRYNIYLNLCDGIIEVNDNICTGSGNSGIYLVKTDGVSLHNNFCTVPYYGIKLSESNGITITDSICGGGRGGISIFESKNITIQDCTIRDNDEGIRLSDCKDVRVSGTIMENTGINIIGGEREHWNSHSIDTSNTVNGRTVRYYANTTDITVPEDAGQVILYNCHSVTITDQNLSHGSVGILMAYSENNTIESNDCSYNYYGLFLHESHNNTITRNFCSYGSRNGIEIYGSHNIIKLNDCSDLISQGAIGIVIRNGQGNEIKFNNCSNYREESTTSILIQDISNHITNNICLNCYYGIVIRANDCVIENNTSSFHVRYGISIHYDVHNHRIVNNTCNNNEDGIYLQRSSGNMLLNNTFRNNVKGIHVFTESIDNHAHYNTIAGNSQFGISTFSSSPINATDNWWGDETGPYHPQYNPNGKGDNISDDVEYEPWIGQTKNVLNMRTGKSYFSIQKAIDEAIEGDQIRVHDGSYNEQVYINISLSITGNGSSTTTINGLQKGDVVRIQADKVTLSGLLVTGTKAGTLEYSGVRVSSDGNQIRNCEFRNNDMGLCVSGSNNLILDNLCKENTAGIALSSATNNQISLVSCTSNKYGIHLTQSSNNTLDNNNCSGNDFGIYLVESSDNSITYNLANENSDQFDPQGIHLEKSHRNLVANNICNMNNESGIHLTESNENVLENNQCLINGEVGILVEFSHRNIFANNTCTNTHWYGIYLKGSDNNVFNGNMIINNTWGIHFHSSSHNTLTMNTIVGNQRGFYPVVNSKNNSLHYNAFYNNSYKGIDAWDNRGHVVNATYNWWNTLSGPYHQDLNPDGEGDNVTDDVLFDPWLVIPNDNMRPVAVIDIMDPNPALLGESVTLQGHGTDDGEIIAYRWHSSEDGPLYTGSDNEIFLDNLSIAHHDISFSVQDNWGVWSIPVVMELIVHVPPIAIIDTIDPSPANDKQEVTFTGHGEDDGPIIAFHWSSTIDGFLGDGPLIEKGSLTQGEHEIRFKVQDEHGIWSAVISRSLTITMYVPPIEPNIPPTLTITSPEDGSKLSGKVTMKGTTTDTDGVVTKIEIRIGEDEWQLINGTGSWEFILDTNKISNGSYNIKVRCFDGEDFSNISSISITVENKDNKETNEKDDDGGGDGFIPFVHFQEILLIMILAALMYQFKRKSIKY